MIGTIISVAFAIATTMAPVWVVTYLIEIHLG